jgi:hypothetical protein
MPWTPSEAEARSLKNDIKQRFGFFRPDQEKSINLAFEELKQCKGKKQAEAIVREVEDYADIKKLRIYGFDKLTQNSRAAIRAALDPAVLQAAAQQAHATELQNNKIEGYLQTVTGGNFNAHRAGTFNKTLPLEDVVGPSVVTIARRFYNAEGVLPAGGDYIEWYPVVGGTRSASKRFFTSNGGATRIWYTEGGTHGETLEWWTKTAASGTWERWQQ